jgi:hypothetical protein
LYDTIFAEQHHRPAVALVNEGFVHDARSAGASKGMPGVRFVPQKVPCECTVPEKIEAGVQAAINDVVAALTTPLRPEEVSPPPRPTELTHGTAFSGDLAEVQRFFYKRGWSDGLPIMPPTRGALPTAMPLLIAGVEALLDPLSSFGIFEVSTGSWAPFFIVNGPVRGQLRINGGTGALSPGDLANATIGRAMGLIVKNLGGARKGIEDMGVLGNPGKYSMVVAEHEEASPWEPQHVQLGFGRDDNCLTVSFPNSYVQIVPRGTDDKGILDTIRDRLGPYWRQLTLLVAPSQAATLAEAGWTKAALIEHLERARPEVPSTGVGRLSGPESVRVVVVGGPGAWIALVLGVGQWVTKPITLPANWDGLVKKYRDYVPNYLRY